MNDHIDIMCGIMDDHTVDWTSSVVLYKMLGIFVVALATGYIYVYIIQWDQQFFFVKYPCTKECQPMKGHIIHNLHLTN